MNNWLLMQKKSRQHCCGNFYYMRFFDYKPDINGLNCLVSRFKRKGGIMGTSLNLVSKKIQEIVEDELHLYKKGGE